MKVKLFMTFFLPLLAYCQESPSQPANKNTGRSLSLHTVADIPLPAGYTRINGRDSGFARWLRNVAVKDDKTVYLYNGDKKRNQTAQYAVLNIPVGAKDLQQCADAVMRLRAEYLYSNKKYHAIWFADNNDKKYQCPANCSYSRFEKYLENVFAWCGTLSLERQLKKVAAFSAIQPGDVLIKGGSPGHAVLVMDVAENRQGKRIYLLAQSYMPAQDIHILINPVNSSISPWYAADEHNPMIYTPEWSFTTQQLKRW